MFGLDIVIGVAILCFFVGGIIGILTSTSDEKNANTKNSLVDFAELTEGDHFIERDNKYEVIIVKVFIKNIRRRRYSLVKYEFAEQPGYVEILPTRYFLSNFVKKVN